MKKETLKIILIASLFCGICVFFVFYSRERLKPNVIVMAIDTLRADHLGCYGYDKPTSPIIDKFSQDAVLFKNVLSQAPSTAPSFMTLFTSLVPAVHEIADQYLLRSDERRALCSGIPTLAEILKKNNYMTVGFYETGSLLPDLGFGRGFDFYSDKTISWNELYQNASGLTPLTQWIKRSKRSQQPLFLFLHHYICHDPYVRAPEAFRSLFIKNDLILSSDMKDVYKEKSFETQSEIFWKSIDLSNPKHKKFVVGLYDSSIRYADYVFGQILEILKKEKIYDNSIVILLSDHGEEFNEHGGRTHGRLFIETLRVPLIIKFPKNKYHGLKISKAVRLMDVMPTLFDFLNIKINSYIQGMSFSGLLKKGSFVYRPFLLSYSPKLDRVRFSYQGFVYTVEPDGKNEEWLFDASLDPNETHNLALISPRVLEITRKMSQEIIFGDLRFKDKFSCGQDRYFKIDAQVKEKLRSLGYAQ
jgi:membrane-anchored protein YejM (alkaline phosphatase superfamily)